MSLLPWHTRQWQTLQQQIGQNRLPHAMLMHGPQGVGKWQFVNTLAAALLCEKSQGSMACGGCSACHLLAVNNHPDLQVVRVEDDKKSIAIDQIRDLIEYLSLTPHSASFKIAIVNEADLMTVNAANSLLKTLEEPPSSALIFLISHHPERLLPTILSRCQKISFALPPEAMADEWLAQSVGQAGRRKALLALANGAPLLALEFEHQDVIEQRQQQFAALLELGQGKLDPVSAAEIWLKLDLEMTINNMQSWVMDLLRLKTSTRPPKLTNADLQDSLSQLARQASLQGILQFQSHLFENTKWIGSNANPQLMMEDVLIRWISLIK